MNAPEAPAIQRLLRASNPARRPRARGRLREAFSLLAQGGASGGALDLLATFRKGPGPDGGYRQSAATDDLHPVIVDLLLEAARKVHGSGSLLTTGRAPALLDRELPVSEDAERIYRGEYSSRGAYLPFWAAVWAHRFMFFAIPLLAIGIPLLRCLPFADQWRTRRRMDRAVRRAEAAGARAAPRLG